MTRTLEFNNQCTFLMHPSCGLYSIPTVSLANTIAQATGLGDKLMLDADKASLCATPQTNLPDLQKRLESVRNSVKLEALKEVILWAVQPPNAANEIKGIIGGSSGFTSSTNVASRLLVTIIRFVLPSEDHQIKKLLQLYWETVDKTNPDGTLREEMILVCNKWRQDLLHPNEYIRGSTLRLLSKMRYAKILEPLIESTIENMKHSHPYVRRNAIMCANAMVKHFGLPIIPQAVDQVHQILSTETDVCAKRNAFLMLIHCDIKSAVSYLLSLKDKILHMGDVFQLATLELLCRTLHSDASSVHNLLPVVASLVSCPSCSPAVAYEGASTLLRFSCSPGAIEIATRAYISLLTKEADNNVKLSVLERLNDILKTHPSVLEDYAVDIFRVLSSPSLEIRKKCLAIGFKLFKPCTASNILSIIKKELLKTLAMDNQQIDAASLILYQRLLLKHLRSISRDFAHLLLPMIPLLLGFLADGKPSTSTEVVSLFHSIVVSHEELRGKILKGIAAHLVNMSQSCVCRTCLWMLGEYFVDAEQRNEFLNVIFNALLPLPFPEQIGGDLRNNESGLPSHNTLETMTPKPLTINDQMKITTRTVVLQDGTYGTQDVYQNLEKSSLCSINNSVAPEKKESSNLRSLILSGDFLLSSVVAVTVTKLFTRPTSVQSQIPPDKLKKNHSRCLLIVVSLYRACTAHPSCPPTSAAAVRILQMVHILTSQTADVNANARLYKKWFATPQELLPLTLQLENETADALCDSSLDLPCNSSEETHATSVDDVISFRQLGQNVDDASYRGSSLGMLCHPDVDLDRALGKQTPRRDSTLYQERLSKVQQLTGFTDPLYVEAFVQLNQFDFFVELFLVNRSTGTLQNVSIELLTHGDSKLVEHPKVVNLSPGMSKTVHASLRVHYTETAVIFGHVTFSRSSKGERENLVFNELHIDLLDFIVPRCINYCAFRSMWAAFEWENKIAINTSLTDVSQYMEHILEKTNMTIVGNDTRYCDRDNDYPHALPVTNECSPETSFADTLHYPKDVWTYSSLATKGRQTSYSSHTMANQFSSLKRVMSNSAFFAVNLYSKSIFDEDTLANISIEKLPTGKLVGSIRIRSRTQGIALSLGDLITVIQRTCPEQVK